MREISRKKPIIRNRVPEHVERAVIELAIENPALGQLRVAQELLQRGIVVSSGGVRSIWLRNELETMKTPESLGNAVRARRVCSDRSADCGAGKSQVTT